MTNTSLLEQVLDWHKHQCPVCDYVWEHCGSLIDDYDKAHVCPNCEKGKDKWKRGTGFFPDPGPSQAFWDGEEKVTLE